MPRLSQTSPFSNQHVSLHILSAYRMNAKRTRMPKLRTIPYVDPDDHLLCRLITENMPNLRTVLLFIKMSTCEIQRVMSSKKERFSWARAVNKLPVGQKFEIKLLVKNPYEETSTKELEALHETCLRFLKDLLRPTSLLDSFDDGFGLEELFLENQQEKRCVAIIQDP